MWNLNEWRMIARLWGLLVLMLAYSGAVYADERTVSEYTLQQALSQNADEPNIALSLKQTIQKAVEFSRFTIADRAGQLAESELSQAELVLPDPVLSLQLNNLPVNGATGFDVSAEPITRRTIGISQKWERTDRRQKSSNVSAARAEQAKWREINTVSMLKQETAKAWLDAYFGQKKVDLLQERVAELKIRSEASAALYNAGTGSQSNVFSARAEEALARLQLQRAQAELSNYLAQLQRWVGDQVHPLDNDDIVWGQLDVPPEDLLNAALYPAVQMQAQEVEQAKAFWELQKESLQPDWTLSVQYSQRGSQFSDTLSLAASRPLLVNSEDRQMRQIAAAQARFEAAQAQQTEFERAMRTRVQQLLENWNDGVLRIQELEAELLPLATQRTQAALSEYKGNVGNLEQVLLARRMEIDLNIELLELKMETARWWAQLQYLLPEKEAL